MGCFQSKEQPYQVPADAAAVQAKQQADAAGLAKKPVVPPQPAKQSGALGDTAFGDLKTLEDGEVLRAKANKAADEASKLGAESKAAYSSGDGAKAKELSTKSKARWEEQKAANAAAADIIFAVKNHDRGQWSIDLHLLLVAEAEAKTKRRLASCVAAAAAEASRKKDLVIVYGAGHHSAGGVQKIKPAVLKLLSDLGFKEIKDEFDSAEGRPNVGCVSVTVSASHPMAAFKAAGAV